MKPNTLIKKFKTMDEIKELEQCFFEKKLLNLQLRIERLELIDGIEENEIEISVNKSQIKAIIMPFLAGFLFAIILISFFVKQN